jgi:CDP-glycerol glycerophosphotransferase (TagB/SpsB family)
LDHFADVFRFDFVFLQHGIIRHDLSGWLNRFEQNVKLLVTSAKAEYDSILKLPYFYEPGNVLLSGLPRYDRLVSAPKGKLILAPTYRKNLLRMRTDKSGARGYDPQFRNSEYRNFYNRYMNDERVVAALQKAGMEGELYIHPALEAQARDFEANQAFAVKPFPYDYSAMFRDGNLLVSDYSSVVFDFAYLKKPVIYAQFDRKVFFAGQNYDSSEFFEDARDGFGPVVYTYEDLVKETLAAIDNSCQMQSVYSSRVDKFFYKRDKNNSARVYEAIIKMGQSKGV